jgi:hypothetical protein
MTSEVSETTRTDASRRHPRFLEPASLLLIAPLCVIGAIIGAQPQTCGARWVSASPAI